MYCLMVEEMITNLFVSLKAFPVETKTWPQTLGFSRGTRSPPNILNPSQDPG